MSLIDKLSSIKWGITKKEFRDLFSDKEWFPDHPTQNACSFKDLIDHKDVFVVAYFIIDRNEDCLARICISFDHIETDNQRKFIFENQLSDLKNTYGQPLYTSASEKNTPAEYKMSEFNVWIKEDSVISAGLALFEDVSTHPSISISFGDKVNDPISKELLWIERRDTEENSHIEKTLNIILSSTRIMPAKLSRNGDRAQSFCVNFSDLSLEADEEMAAQSYGAINFYLSNEKLDYDFDEKIFYSILMMGEDIMLGSFILTKFGDTDSWDSLRQAVIKYRLDNLEKEVPNLKSVLTQKEVEDYFQHCIDFGRETAQKY